MRVESHLRGRRPRALGARRPGEVGRGPRIHVGGGVRDLLLERQPKDFDVGTSAHPQQVRKLFRNCFIVGRRFRLAHVRFGRKVIEVSPSAGPRSPRKATR